MIKIDTMFLTEHHDSAMNDSAFLICWDLSLVRFMIYLRLFHLALFIYKYIM